VPWVPPDAEEELRALRALVREMRVKLGLSQDAAGLDGDLGRKYLGQVERGELVPTVRGLTGLAQALGMTTAAFLRAYADRLESTPTRPAGPGLVHQGSSAIMAELAASDQARSSAS
jgi:transcriptional regulator with XRE-family HTH domain